jgi:hypothetical protein
MKKIIRISLFCLLCLLFINSINLKAKSSPSLFDEFIYNISNASTKHISYKTDDCTDLHFYNSYIEGFIVLSEKDSNSYLNLLLINKTPNIEVEIYFQESSKEFVKKIYDVNGSTYIYGLSLSDYSDFDIHVLIDDILISVFEYNIETYNNILNLKGTVTNGTADYPDNVIHETIKNKLVNLIIVCGIVFCIFLALIIFVIVKSKKVNIKREDPFMFVRKMDEPVPNLEEKVIDVPYEEPKVTNKMPDLNDPKYLTELYRKKLSNEISEKEFELALNRYRASKDLEEDDD